MARLAREENETLKARISALEAKLGVFPGGAGQRQHEDGWLIALSLEWEKLSAICRYCFQIAAGMGCVADVAASSIKRSVVETG